jgi:3-dehydroquinate synthase
MVVACGISAHVSGLDPTVAGQLKALLQQYGLPAGRALNADRVMEVLINDKKRKGDDIDYIVLEKIGRAAVMPLPLSLIDREIRNYDSNH